MSSYISTTTRIVDSCNILPVATQLIDLRSTKFFCDEILNILLSTNNDLPYTRGHLPIFYRTIE